MPAMISRFCNAGLRKETAMQLGTITIPDGAVLAPMAGVTDYAYREICADLGAVATVTEMVSAKALCYQDKKTVTLLRRNEGVPCGAQIFGSEPEVMARGAALHTSTVTATSLTSTWAAPCPKSSTTERVPPC